MLARIDTLATLLLELGSHTVLNRSAWTLADDHATDLCERLV
jgi:hypothetical protein